MSRVALLSMDVEDWYHLEYFRHQPCGTSTSLLDGTERFAELLQQEQVSATFFTLTDVARADPGRIRRLTNAGFEVASHGPDHTHLSQLDTMTFAAQLRAAKSELEDITGTAVRGYRAPCFSMDESKLSCLVDLGFDYDSSWIRFEAHPLYGQMALRNWIPVRHGVFRAPDSAFLEFEIPTVTIAGRRLPVAGGAYFRVFPWLGLRSLIRRFISRADTYILYIHPFECSIAASVPYPDGTSRRTKLRFQLGREKTLSRIAAVIGELRRAGFKFKTFSQVVDAVR